VIVPPSPSSRREEKYEDSNAKEYGKDKEESIEDQTRLFSHAINAADW
jgi:hypothetical protein